MSLVSSRISLIHRVTIERNQATADAWGNPGPPSWQSLVADLPCRAWVESGREPVSEDRTVTVITYHVAVPLGTDVTEDDRIASVTERGASFFAGPIGITAVLRHEDHLELIAERVH